MCFGLVLTPCVTFAGHWQVKFGGSVIAPTGESMIANIIKVKADDQYSFTPSVEYFFADTAISTELLFSNPIKKDMFSKPFQQSSTKDLPPTLTFKYNFLESNRFNPYVGAGLMILLPVEQHGAIEKVDRYLGMTGQIGFNFQPADAKKWGVFADVRYADLKPKVTLAGGTQFNFNIDPLVYTIGYSYRF